AGQSVHQQRRAVLRLPSARAIVVQHQLIAVGQSHVAMGRAIVELAKRQERSGQSLRMAAAQQRMRTKRRDLEVAHGEKNSRFLFTAARASGGQRGVYLPRIRSSPS